VNEPIRDYNETLMASDERRSRDEQGCHVMQVRQICSTPNNQEPKRKGPKEKPLESTIGKAQFHQLQKHQKEQPCNLHIICPKCGKHWETEWAFSRPTTEEMRIERDRVLARHAKAYGECRATHPGRQKK